MTHPLPSPALSTDVVAQMVVQLHQRAIFAKAENTGTAQGDAWHFEGSANMLTALAAQLAERDAELARVTDDLSRQEVLVSKLTDGLTAATARIAALTEALVDAGAMRDAADRVSEWFCNEARHLEGPRIQGLRMAIVAYDRHMQPAALTPTADKEPKT